MIIDQGAARQRQTLWRCSLAGVAGQTRQSRERGRNPRRPQGDRTQPGGAQGAGDGSTQPGSGTGAGTGFGTGFQHRHRGRCQAEVQAAPWALELAPPPSAGCGSASWHCVATPPVQAPGGPGGVLRGPGPRAPGAGVDTCLALIKRYSPASAAPPCPPWAPPCPGGPLRSPLAKPGLCRVWYPLCVW